MRSRILHGLLLGAAWCALAGLVESAVLMLQHPFDRHPGIWLAAWPLYAGGGVLLGVVAGAVLPLLTRRREWSSLPGVYLVGILLGAVAAVLWWPLFDLALPARLGSAALVALAVQQGLRLAAASRWGWLAASLFTPLSAVALLALTLIAGVAGALAPVLQGSRTLPTAAIGEVRAPTDLLVVVLRGVGAAHLGCYGYYRPTSPRLDGVVRDGVLYSSAFAASPSAEHARDSLLGLPLGQAAAAGSVALTERLRLAGFQVAGVGAADRVADARGGLLGFTSYTDPSLELPEERLYLRRRWRELSPPGAPPLGEGEAAVGAALDWLGNRRDPARRFFLLLDLPEALPPYVPPPELREHFLPGGPGLADPASEDPSSGGLDTERALYDAEILSQDQALGQLLDGLADLDLLEGTLIVLVGDTGSCFHPHHPESAPRAALDCLTRVPLALRMPRELPAGTRVGRSVSCADLAPTLLRFLSLADPLEAARALPPIGETDPVAPQEVAILDPGSGDAVLRTPDAKLLRRADGSLLFRDLSADPEERTPMEAPVGGSQQAAAALLDSRLRKRFEGS